MKKIFNYGLLAVMAAALYSCASENFSDQKEAGELKLAQYQASFVNKYGQIASAQDWGFGQTASVATKNSSVTGNNIASYVSYEDVPDKLDEEKKEDSDVVQAFKNNTGQNIAVEDFNWSDFFVQHVYAGKHSYVYRDSNGATHTISNASSHMNLLSCNGRHVNSFNGGNCSRNEQVEFIVGKDANGQVIRERKNVDCVLMQDSKTSFTYQNSRDGKVYSDYIIKKINGSYYIGFDYRMAGLLEGDGIYDDWIIKVTPAKYKNTWRIMAEDLNTAGGDFDFNDVVFDAAIINGKAVITLQAAGGTMPLYIEGWEVHELFGVSQSTMVNTYDKGKNAPVIFRLKGNYSNIIDIPIKVNGILLPSGVGKAPGKLCCPTSCEWTDERQSIDQKYSNFSKAVENGSINWWE